MKAEWFPIAACIALALIFGYAPYAFADHSVIHSIAHGKELFNDPKLGNNTTGLTCNGCHPVGGTAGGEAGVIMSSAVTFPKVKGPQKKVITLGQMINVCIANRLKGEPLDLNSQDAVDLVAYVTSLSQGKAVNLAK